MKEHLSEIIFLLLGSAGGGTLHWLINRRGSDIDTSAARIITNDNTDLRIRINLLESNNAEHVHNIGRLERENYELKMKIELMEFAPFQIPLPMWQKNFFGVIDYINDEYENIFLKPRGKTKDDYLGKTDFEVWPRDIAESFRKNDTKVLETGEVFNGRENIVDAFGNITPWRILKFPRKVPRGVAGVAFPDNGYFDKHFQR